MNLQSVGSYSQLRRDKNIRRRVIMHRDDLLKEIDEKRKLMLEVAELKGMDSLETLQCSKVLDDLMNELQKLEEAVD